MATIEELLASEDFVDPLPIDYFSGEFGREELAGLIPAQAALRGRPVIPSRPTGVSGKDIERAVENENLRAAKLGLTAMRAASARQKAFDQAAYKRQLEEAAAERASKAAKLKLELGLMGIAGGMFEDISSAEPAVSSAIIKDVKRRNAVKAEDRFRRENALDSQYKASTGMADILGSRLEDRSKRLRERGLVSPGVTESPVGLPGGVLRGAPRIGMPESYESAFAGPSFGLTRDVEVISPESALRLTPSGSAASRKRDAYRLGLPDVPGVIRRDPAMEIDRSVFPESTVPSLIPEDDETKRMRENLILSAQWSPGAIEALEAVAGSDAGGYSGLLAGR